MQGDVQRVALAARGWPADLLRPVLQRSKLGDIAGFTMVELLLHGPVVLLPGLKGGRGRSELNLFVSQLMIHDGAPSACQSTLNVPFSVLVCSVPRFPERICLICSTQRALAMGRSLRTDETGAVSEVSPG